MEQILNKIVNIYINILPKVPIMLGEVEAKAYFERLMMNGNIITYAQDGELKGFIEYWRITPEILGKVIIGLPISHDTDLLNGDVCLITHMWIDENERSGHTFYHLAAQFLKANMNVTHYVALQNHKHHKPIQIYTRAEILKHYKLER